MSFVLWQRNRELWNNETSYIILYSCTKIIKYLKSEIRFLAKQVKLYKGRYFSSLVWLESILNGSRYSNTKILI